MGTLTPLKLMGQQTQSLNIKQCIGSSKTCDGITIHCPLHDNNGAHCNVPGEGMFGSGIHIYAVSTWEDLNITNYDADNNIVGTMHCGKQSVDFNEWKSCNISNENGKWDCTESHLCSLAVFNDPTFEPTLEPTSDPTDDPTTDPTVNPTVSPSVDPTLDPTLDPTVQPTEPSLNPTTSPTNEPTMYPTQSPVVENTLFEIENVRWGFVSALVVILLFVCIICCGWRYWRKGYDVSVGGKKRKVSDKKVQLNEESDDDGIIVHDDYEIDDDDKYEEMSDENEAVEVVEVAQNMNTEKSKKKKRKKKKKNKKKKNEEEDNAGDYQKQTDNPFETNQWTELTEFD